MPIISTVIHQPDLAPRVPPRPPVPPEALRATAEEAQRRLVAGSPSPGLAHLWAILHRAALAPTGTFSEQFLAAFRKTLPCGECRRHWDAWVAENPRWVPDPFAWTVAAHNAVNARLVRKVWSVEEARARWGS